ncbi:endolytic transglycosylase MltG [Paenibacillus sp. J5C_2022]|uniref:endolytic transglycosylase MltG n=1 Tax=Paenibacillus sp. J5C2022 TaxID=2977129 RepID=UPI0021CEA428|nr:endolytic transglycosylase MltG [Paenibacillus sp. J5C2022]MCU6709650.1 endolytic transglycosylase MltG [Paenibacillus sp. J5C2022]
MEEKETSKKKKRRKAKKGPRAWVVSFWVALSLLGIMAIAACAVLFYLWSNLQPLPKGEPKKVTISRGMSANGVADTLEKNGIIKNGFLFGYYLQMKDEGAKFQAGVYEFHPGMDNATIINMLNTGDVVEAETVQFTIPEGYTVEQIAQKLGKEGLVDPAKFLQLAGEDRTWSDAEAVLSVPKEQTGIKQRLEGYLFPETYAVKRDSSEEVIIQRMLQETDRKLDTLPEDWQEVLGESGRSLHEIMTVASLVEREVVVDEERPLVASVIYNRLKQPMRLQIDATVQYALGEQKERLLHKDLEIDSPYNTYKIDGLPPGPIASPSIASIEAALYPADTDYLFYVTKKDGTQSHLFAKTYKEHQRNIAASEKTAE